MATKRIPISRVIDVIGNGRVAFEMVRGTVRVDVRVDALSPRWVVEAVRDDLTQQQSGGIVDVRRLGAHPAEEAEVDAAVVIAGGSDRLVSDVVRSYVGSGVPTAVLAESSLDVPELALPEELERYCTLVAASDRAALDAGLAEWLLESTDKHVSMAANFPFCRSLEAERLERRCAAENAAVGAVDLLHGADLPIMCGNQLKLYFDLSASRGRGLSAHRAVGVGAVVALAFWWRAVGRALVRHTPAGKFAMRAAMGYAGTVASSRVMETLLDIEDGSFSLPRPDVSAWASKAAEGLGGLRGGKEGDIRPQSPQLSDRVCQDEDPDYLTYGAEGGVR